MQKWEYLRLNSNYMAGKRSLCIDNKRVMDAKDVYELQLFINRLGSEGWEMISQAVFSNSYDEIFYFKRPIEEKPSD